MGLSGSGEFADLGLLRGLSLEHLFVGHTRIADLEALADMKLRRLWCDNTPVKDVSPLLRCPTLEQLIPPRGAENLGVLRDLPNLQFVSFSWNAAVGRPSMTAEEFWADIPRELARGLVEAGQLKEADALLMKAESELSADPGPLQSARLAVLRDLVAIRIWDGRPEQAKAPLEEAMRLSRERWPAEPDTGELVSRYIQILYSALAGERKAITTACAEAVERVRQNRDASLAQRALLCVTIPQDSGVPAAAIRDLVEAGRPMESGPVRYWYQIAAGLGHYRLGEDREALAFLDKIGVFENPASSSLADLTRALIALRAGDRDKADFHHRRAKEALARRWPPSGKGAFDERYWPNWG